MHTIFIVEDDPKIASLLKDHLEKYDYQAIVASDFDSIKEECISVSPSLVLLDINLPKYDGYYWCRQIRTVSTLPIIFISARNGEMDQVMAIENGGDDYITKPFHFEVVMAKIKGLIRRSYGEYAAVQGSKLLDAAGLILSYDHYSLEWKGKSLELTKRELTLLEMLMKHPNQLVARETLLEGLWDDAEFVDDNTLSVNIARTRRKLLDLGLPNVIETIRGAGYKLNTSWRQ